jgi:hypothetical protein
VFGKVSREGQLVCAVESFDLLTFERISQVEIDETRGSMFKEYRLAVNDMYFAVVLGNPSDIKVYSYALSNNDLISFIDL